MRAPVKTYGPNTISPEQYGHIVSSALKATVDWTHKVDQTFQDSVSVS